MISSLRKSKMLLSQIVSGPLEVTKPTTEVAQLTRRLLLDELPVEITVDIASQLDFESFDNILHVSSFMRCILQKYWRSILPFIIEREFGPVDLFFCAFSSSDSGVRGNAKMSARQWLAKLGLGGGYGGYGLCGDGDLERIMNFCRFIKLWMAEFQRLRFYHCQPEHHRLLTDDEFFRTRRAIYIWSWFARLHHTGKQTQSTPPFLTFMRQFSTTELHELSDLYETISAAVNREICPSIATVMEVIGDKTQAENLGWGDRDENVQILGTIMRLGPGDLLRLLRERWRLGGKRSLVRWVRMREPWIEDSTEVMSMAILGVKLEREMMTGLERGVFPVEGFPGRYGGVLDHEGEGEELRGVYEGDGGRDWCRSGRYGSGSEGVVIGGVREGRLVVRRYG